MPETKLPGIPSLRRANLDPQLRRYLEALQEALQIRLGQRGDPLDQLVTRRQLFAAGLAKAGRAGGIVIGDGVGLVVDEMMNGDGAGGGVLPLSPPKAAGLAAFATVQNIILAWTNPNFFNLAYTEVWSASVNDLGAATRIGTTPAQVFKDSLGESLATRYYWIRHVSTSGQIGDWNAGPTGGTSATTSQNDTVDIQDDAISTPKLQAGSITAESGAIAALAVLEANIADGSVTNLKIGQFIQATGYTPGVAGWHIHKDGTAEFNDIFARGDIEATSIKVDVADVVSTLHLQGQAVTFSQLAYTEALFAIPESNALPSGSGARPFLAATQEGAISGVTQANPGVVTTPVAHGLSSDYYVMIDGVVGMTELNGNLYEIEVISATQFELRDASTGANIDTTGFGAYVSGGTFRVANGLGVLTPIQSLTVNYPGPVGYAPGAIGIGGMFYSELGVNSELILAVQLVRGSDGMLIFSEVFNNEVAGVGMTQRWSIPFYFLRPDDPGASASVDYVLLAGWDVTGGDPVAEPEVRNATIFSTVLKR